MADLMPSLLAFPPEKQVSAKEYDKQAWEHIKTLAKLPDPTWTKPVNKQNILDLLNPSVNSLPYLFALDTQIQSIGKDRGKIEEAVNRSLLFFTSFDPVQARYAGQEWIKLIEWAFEIYPRIGVRDFSPLTSAMLRLDPTAATFTSSHLRLVRLCLDAGVPRQALPILDKNIYAFPPAPVKHLPDEILSEEHDLSNAFITAKSGHSLALKSEYILEYYLLGAHVYIGMRNFARARLFLEYLLLTPTHHHAVSALQVEAFKKWMLIGLLAKGDRFPLPRTHDQQVFKSLKATTKAYEALAECFEKRQWRKFAAEMEVGAQVWSDDGNLRLVREVGEALLRYRVIDLQKTFAALPVSRVAARLSLPSDAALQLLTEMIRVGYLDATVTSTSAADPVLQFNHTAISTNKPDLEAGLEARTASIQSLIASVRDADRRLQLTKEYVDFTKRHKRSGAGPDGDLADQMDLTWDAPIGGLGGDDGGDDEDGDEDIMAS